MTSFSDYQSRAAQYITFIDSEFYPDYLDEARIIYGSVIEQFSELANMSSSSTELLIRIADRPNPSRTQLLRVFRKYVSPDTSVEMLKVKKKIPNIIADYGHRFRDIEQVKANLANRPNPDEALMAILIEYKSRGQKGYELTEAFFLWSGLTQNHEKTNRKGRKGHEVKRIREGFCVSPNGLSLISVQSI